MTGTLLTTVEVAERLGLSSAAVAQAVRTGALQPTARTTDDLLFTERAVAAFAERRAAAATSPIPAPAPGTRVEWTGDLDRLNSWLKDLTQATPPRVGDQAPQTRSVLIPVVEAPALDFRPPPVPASEPAAPAPPPVSELPPEPPAAQPEPVEPALPIEPVPAVAELVPERPAPASIAARSLRERIEAAQPGLPETAPAATVPAPVAPEPEPVAPAPEPTPVPPVAEPEVAAAPESVAVAPAAPEPEPVAAVPEPISVTPVAEPEPAAAPEPVVEAPALPLATAGLEPSRQAILAVQPIVRFRVLRDVAGRLATIPGIADARLERLENGVAAYRISFEGERPSGEAIGAALADLNLVVILVDSFV